GRLLSGFAGVWVARERSYEFSGVLSRSVFFFFQAEDGIRDLTVTGVQTCALPIFSVLEPVRRIHARSDFVRRLQQWPRGYPGDFETVEYLCHGRSHAESGTIQDICETYSLTRSIAQQHRNKVQHQAARIMRTLLDKP